MRTATSSSNPAPPSVDGRRSRSLLRAVFAVLFATSMAVVALSGPADAADISIPFDDLVFGQPGSVVTIATVDVPADMVGKTCHLAVLAENQSSVHIGNDLIVSTGTSQAVIFGVEDTANGGTTETYEMVVGPTISVQLRIGGDGMSSLGFDLSFDCVEPIVEVSTTIAQQVVSTTTPPSTMVCSSTTATVAGQAVSSTVAGGAVSTTACVPSPCGSAAAGGVTSTAAGGAATTVAGQAVTPTTVCPNGAVTGSTVTAPTTVPTTVAATVAGSAANQLPQTPAAPAVAGSPSYTG